MAKQHILIVDDEPNLLESFKIGLELKGYTVSIASSGKKALVKIGKQAFDVVLLDIRMPGMDGMETLEEIKRIRPDQVVLMLTGQGSLESAVEAGRAGAFGYLEKPSAPETVDFWIQKAVENQAVRKKLEDIETLVGDDFEGVVGKSQAISEVFDLTRRVAPTDSTILITGETGTGKELIASALHLNSKRRENRFFALHCAAIPEELLESELFGHEKGSFTGALAQKTGYFEAADGGTLFLDEVGEMSQAAQVRLLRVLQEKEFIRVGSTTPIKTDVRLVAATNRDLEKEVKEGRFREDLYYRLNVIQIHLPALRERRDDIPLLLQHFLEKYKTADAASAVTEDCVNRLVRHDWPGNVRELENVIERAVALCQSEAIDLTDLPNSIQTGGTPFISETGGYSHLSLQEARESFEQVYIKEVLTKTNGNITHASKMAGIAWQNFHQKLKKYSIDAKSFNAKKKAAS
jgi:DNA-binding NtrC family response regulator